MYRAAGLQANGVQIVPSLLKSTDVALHGACFWAPTGYNQLAYYRKLWVGAYTKAILKQKA